MKDSEVLLRRWQAESSPALLGSIWGIVGAVAVADYFAPLGIAIYILYMVPVALTFVAWRPRLPLLVAAVGSALVIIDYVMAEKDPVLTRFAHYNRSFGTVTLWMLAAIGHQFIRVRLKTRQETWLQEGQTALSARLVGEQRIEELGDNLLGFLTRYLDAQAGALFVEIEGTYHRAASHAAMGGSVPEHFGPGEGFLGQAAKDGQWRFVSGIPEGYLATGSSFGQAPPRHLLVMPVVLEGAVHGVLELGFYDPILEADTLFLKRVETAIAVAIRSANYRTLLQDLLQTTQQQAEELQAQSEELRVSNEELEEQSRALRESQSRLELQQTELEQINSQLEEQTQILENQKKDLILAKSAIESQAKDMEQASRYKSDFLANMSHELRTPLNSSLILAKLLAENAGGNLTEEQVKYALTIESAGKDLLSLINDVLDLSKIEAGHLDIHAEPVEVERLLGGLRGMFEPVAAQKSLELTMTVEADAPAFIETDPHRLEQVLKNLLSNALKFTAQGSVKLRVRREPEGRVAFEVSDTGIGIPEDKVASIFDPFYQADGTTARKYGGTGLGLSISQNLARLLGGEILLRSEPGRGSIFTVILRESYLGPRPHEKAPTAPIQPVAKSKPATPPKDRGPGPRQVPDDREKLSGDVRIILVVEDDEPFARIVCDLVHELHFQCLIATTAEDALVLAKQYAPHAIVLDIGLPDNSGLIVLEHLKSNPHTRHIPVHVVSASDHTRTALALGAVGYMMKPVDREELAEALRKLETRFTKKMRRVLLVEDDPAQVRAMTGLLGSREVETVSVGTAADCLKKLKETTFDCMVLDLSLPDASGFSLLETLSSEDDYSFPPVIVYTGRVLSPEEELRLRRYSKSIIIKGAKSPERLLDEVTLFLHQVISDLPPEKQRMLEIAANRDAALEGRRILIAEDDVRNVFALTSVLEHRGVKLQIARNGREALDILEQSLGDPANSVDLVLMDIMMPEMDGFAAMREIRKRREWQRLPIIALTAKAMKNDQEQCLAAGANDYLAKPLDVDKLLSLIRVWMPR